MTSLTPNSDVMKEALERAIEAKPEYDNPVGRIAKKTITALAEASAYEADIGTPNHLISDGYISAAASTPLTACKTLGHGNRADEVSVLVLVFNEVMNNLERTCVSVKLQPHKGPRQ